MQCSQGFSLGELRMFICPACGAKRLVSTDMIAAAQKRNPSPSRATETAKPKPDFILVETLRLPSQVTGTDVYEVYFALTAEVAQKQLASMPVTRQQHYIIFETPEGNFGRDRLGTYTPSTNWRGYPPPAKVAKLLASKKLPETGAVPGKDQVSFIGCLVGMAVIALIIWYVWQQLQP